jgi:hypothetical protein
MFIEGADSQCTPLVADLELDRHHHGSRSILMSMLTERRGGAAAGADCRRRLNAWMSLRDEENGMDPLHNDLTEVYDDSRRVH